MDLRNNLAVHALKGDRKNYKPVKSVLCDSSDPLEIARAFRDRLGLDELYIADLDAIQDSGRTNQKQMIESLSLRENFRIILDAGISDIESAGRWLDLGIHKVVIGSETLNTCEALIGIPTRFKQNRITFSLDCRNGRILSRCPDLESLSPVEALKLLQSSGWNEIILLDLARVGSGRGIDRSWIIEVQASFPDLTLLVGGGITGPQELNRLQSLGVRGVLVATALHNGSIGPQHIPAWIRKPGPQSRPFPQTD